MYNPNTDTMNPQEKFHGFYRGEVVDTNDPKQSGRVRIRIYPMFSGVRDADLPWALFADPAMGGLSDTGSFHIPAIGSHVFCFFENGDHRFPVFFAGAPAIANNVPDTPKLSREDDGTHAAIDAARQTGVEKAGGGTWDEPASAYAAQYPDNTVFKSKSGITVEIDDTDGNVRFHIYHPSGTRTEIDNSGNETEHVEGTKTTVVIGDNNIKVTGDMNINVDGNATIKVGGNLEAEVAGTSTVDSGGEAKVVAPSVKVESSDIQLDSNGTLGKIVTTQSICAFTGNPHPDGSNSCQAGN